MSHCIFDIFGWLRIALGAGTSGSHSTLWSMAHLLFWIVQLNFYNCFYNTFHHFFFFRKKWINNTPLLLSYNTVHTFFMLKSWSWTWVFWVLVCLQSIDSCFDLIMMWHPDHVTGHYFIKESITFNIVLGKKV